MSVLGLLVYVGFCYVNVFFVLSILAVASPSGEVLRVEVEVACRTVVAAVASTIREAPALEVDRTIDRVATEATVTTITEETTSIGTADVLIILMVSWSSYNMD